MSSQQTALQVKVLSLLGWVDGKLDESEHDASRELLKETMAVEALKAELEKMGTTLPVKAEVLADVAGAPPEVARAAIKAGFELARADGYLHQNEFAILLELSAAAGFSKDELARIGSIENIDQAFLELERLY